MEATVRSEKDLLIASKAFTVENRLQSWVALFTTLAVIGALAALAATLPWYLALPAAVIQGLTLVRGFCLYHDFQHGALLRNSTVARGIFWLYGELLLVPPNVWRETHNYHHAHTAKLIGSHIGSYPMLTPKMYLEQPPLRRWLYRAARHPLNISVALLTVFLIGMCVRPFLRAPKKHWDAAVALVIVGAMSFGLIITGHTMQWLFAYVIPMAVATASGAYLFYAQHNFPEAKVASREKWTFTKAATDSSSYMQMSPVMHWFTANIGYHHVHHLNAAIPFYRLPEAMAQIPELQSPGKTSLKPADVLACFKLKLWDPDANQMVGYPHQPAQAAAQPQN